MQFYSIPVVKLKQYKTKKIYYYVAVSNVMVFAFAGEALRHNGPDDDGGAGEGGGFHDAIHEPRHRNPVPQAETSRAETFCVHAAILHWGTDHLEFLMKSFICFECVFYRPNLV